MVAQNQSILAFNRGLVSKYGVARYDVKRLALSAQTMENWMPRVLGSMMLRPGWKYLGSMYNDSAARVVPFIFSTTDTAILEFTDSLMRVWDNDALVTRAANSTVVANGTFPSNLTSWTDNSQAGAAVTWVSAGVVKFVGTGTNYAILDQTVTVGVGDRNVEHALRIVVGRGPIVLRVGTGTTDDSYIRETTLGTGTHSLAFTPTGDFNIRFKSRLLRQVRLTSCVVETTGTLTLPTPYLAADLSGIRYDQSGDIVFLSCTKSTDNIGYQQRMIERRANNSWSITLYQADDGPFRAVNVSTTTMTPSVLTGNGTLTASANFFRATHVGALFSCTSLGQTVSSGLTNLNDHTSTIYATGSGNDRTFTITLSNLTALGAGRTVILQRSFDNSTWLAVSGKSWTADTTETYVDGLDNQRVYYRLLLSVVGGAGTTTAGLTISTGTVRGIGRVTGYTSETVVDIEVLSAFGGTASTDLWAEGAWSDYRGWPSSVAFHEGRLFWSGKAEIWGSVSNSYTSFDANFVGDAGPIDRVLGSGPVDTINFLLSLQRLIIGAQGSEHTAKSSAFDEPLTPTAFSVKIIGTQGSAPVQAVKIDSHGIFVQRGGIRVFDISYSQGAGYSADYAGSDLTQIIPTIGYPGIVRMAVQRQPDTRIHCVRSDGTVALAVFDKIEDVLCWCNITASGTDAAIEDVVTLPGANGSTEDAVYYVVKRVINGFTKRFLEKWALESECRGDAQLCKLADSHITYTGSPATTITGLSHLEGEDVVVWADGADVGTVDTTVPWTQLYTVSGGQIVLAAAASNVVVGLGYTAQFKSAKLGTETAQLPNVLNLYKKIGRVGLVLADVHPKGLRYGPDLTETNMRNLPSYEGGKPVPDDTVRSEYDTERIMFPGTWTTDMRLCLEAQAPRPVTVLAATISAEVIPG